jgi:hypothetical protein
VAKHLQLEITDFDRAGMLLGFDIELDFCLGRNEFLKERKGAKKGKKKLSLPISDSLSK